MAATGQGEYQQGIGNHATPANFIGPLPPLPWVATGLHAMLRQVLRHLEVSTSGEGFTDLTVALNKEIADSGLDTGLAVISALHTSCSLTVNENADPRVLVDLTAYLRALVPQEGTRPLSGQGPLRPYVHDDEGVDDMPAHIRTALTCTSLSLSFHHRRLALGTWQAVYLWEHRARAHRRTLCLHLLGASVSSA
ncbi:MAG: secondary thiamine-phosphate synthase enzyme YjbQ [Cyanobacteriota bacterium]|nr:secondary thiamine-phosphate synthase enzyme YjbQ [Cyanobacteriota bacterium]